jgi:tetratricopeptide (TPR) repeat protein
MEVQMRHRRHRQFRAALVALATGLTVVGAVGVLAAAEDSRARREAFRHYEAGERALTSERYAEAAEEFEKAIALDPRLVLAHYGLGQSRMALRDYPAAVRAYVGCRKAFHDDVASQLQHENGWEQRLNEQIRALEDRIATLSNIGPGTVPSRPLSTTNQQQLEQQLDTLRARRKQGGTAADETPPWISVALGSAYFRNNALADAEREYKAALEVDPNVGEAHNNLAVIYLLSKRPAEAEREVALAEKAGVKVPEGLKQDIARLRASAPAQP